MKVDCKKCLNYEGGTNNFHCAMHPNGPEDGDCEDEIHKLTASDWPQRIGLYYKLDGHEPVPCEAEEFAEFFETDRHVAITELKNLRISTVFLGVNHQFGEGPPILFETMVFDNGKQGWLDLQIRYSTWEEAERGHAEVVRILSSNTDCPC